MSELKCLLGTRIVELLKLIVGPPHTINIRNIIWHGFVNCDPTYEQSYRQLYYFLLSIMVSIGVQLCQPITSIHFTIENNNPNLKQEISKQISQRKMFNFDEFSDENFQSILPEIISIEEKNLRTNFMFEFLFFNFLRI